VITDRDNYTNFSAFSFEVGDRFEPLSGINKAIAQYVKILLTTPGTCSFEPALGGGLLKLPGTKLKAPYGFLAKTAMTLVNVAEDIRQRQAQLKMPSDEKLQSVEVLFIDFSEGDPSSIEAKIKVTTASQSNIPVSMTLGVQGLLESIQAG